MISTVFEYITLLILIPVLLPLFIVLQTINMCITLIQYCFVKKKYNNLQELFSENSQYITNIFPGQSVNIEK